MNGFLLLALTAGLLSPIAAKAEVDSKVHKMCLQAKDYMGCVKAQSKQGATPSSKKVIKNLITSERVGNACPEGYAYIMDNLCQKVDCHQGYSVFSRRKKDDPIVAGKSTWKCPITAFEWAGSLRLGALGEIGYTPACPPGPPRVGWNSTCEAPYIKTRTRRKLPMACQKGIWEIDDPRCQLSEEKIVSPMDME